MGETVQSPGFYHLVVKTQSNMHVMAVSDSGITVLLNIVLVD
jgi:hypothetical protein